MLARLLANKKAGVEAISGFCVGSIACLTMAENGRDLSRPYSVFELADMACLGAARKLFAGRTFQADDAGATHVDAVAHAGRHVGTVAGTQHITQVFVWQRQFERAFDDPQHFVITMAADGECPIGGVFPFKGAQTRILHHARDGRRRRGLRFIPALDRNAAVI